MIFAPHKKITSIFIGLVAAAIVLIIIALTLSLYKGIVIVTPTPMKADINFVVKAKPQASEEQMLAGRVFEETIEAEKKVIIPGSKEVEGHAKGIVTVFNDYSKEQILVRTTSFLSKEGVLFRSTARIVIPAKGQTQVEIRAEEPGASGDIEPTTFGIPKLSQWRQKYVYAKSDSPMTGGLVRVGMVKQTDIAQAKNQLQEEIYQAALGRIPLADLKKQGLEGLTTRKKILDFSSSAQSGDKTGEFTIKLKIKVTLLALNEEKALSLALAKLEKSVPAGKTLIQVEKDSFQYSIESYKIKPEEADVRIKISGQLTINTKHPIFNKEKLKNLTRAEATTYLESFPEEIEKIEIKFRPFWVKRMPTSEKHIEIKIKKSLTQ